MRPLSDSPEQERFEKRLEELHPLIAYIREKFENAKAAKQEIEDRMVEAIRAYRMEYPPDKLHAIRDLGGSEVYLPLVNIKVRALKAWLTDIFFRPGEPPFDIEPSPVPELPTEEALEVKREFVSEISSLIQKAFELQQLSGGAFDISSVLKIIAEKGSEIQTEFMNQVQEKARKLAEIEKKRLDDQFLEGGFYEALDEVLLDIALFPAAIMKGSVPRKKRVFGPDRTPEDRVIPTFNRVSPFDIYPSPTAPDFSDWVIEVLHLTPQDLYSLKGVDGYNEAAIDVILAMYGDTGYSMVTYPSDRWKLEGKDPDKGTTIDVLEFWGEIPGHLLTDVDITSPDGEWIEIDENSYYNVAVWICDDYIIKAVINPDPLGEKPYSKVSFVTIPDSFWGLSLVDVLLPIQDAVNALSRATINNAVLSSGPMIERNIDRVPSHEDKTVVPWKIFDSTDLGFNSAPAYRFYQPNLTSAALVQVIAYYLKLADELSGVPAYSHSDVTSGAAARTASGMQLLMQSSSRGIKQVVKAIDEGIIKPVVKRQYTYNLINYYSLEDDIPDLNIKAKGTIYLMEREAQTQRLLEILSLTNNPVDLQLLGLEGRRYILEKVISNFGIDIPFTSELSQMVSSLEQQLKNYGAQQAKPSPEQSPIMEMAGEARRQSLQASGGMKVGG